MTQLEIASEPVCLVSKTRKKTDLKTILKKSTEGIYFPAKSSPMTSALIEQLNADGVSFVSRGFVDDIAFLRLLALETDALVAIPRIGIRREIEAKELFVIHEFDRIRQSYFLIHRQKGKRHQMIEKLKS